MAMESTLIPLGIKAPDFTLPDTISGKQINLYDYKGNIATVIMMICNHCPYVKHIIEKVTETAKDYQHKGISFLGISSNDVINYPEDSPENMKELGNNLGFSFPYLFDERQDVARLYEAACTPDFYVFDVDLKLVYHGQFDDSRPKNDIPVSGKELKNALDNLINGKQIDTNQKQSIGCSIKWKQ
ncbi:MAG: thioredoxin family protein [Ignavibacteriales bacterium]|nr:MAG: thioredoxin family protein [Ignavibacteriales bacterium]